MAYKDTILADAPILYTTFDEAGSTVADSSTAARTVTTAGSPVKAAGISGTALVFDGVDDSVSAAAVADHTSGSFTWETWFKSTQTTGTGTFIRRDGNGAAYLLRVNAGKIEWYGNNGAMAVSPTIKADGQWHHVVGVKNGTALTLYVDGVSVATGTATSTATGTTALYLGAAGGTSEYFNGTLDEVAVYSTPLSAARITAHYNARVSPSVTNQAPAMVVNITAPAPVVTGVNGYDKTTVSTADDDFVNIGAGSAASLVLLGDSAPQTGYFNFADPRLAGAAIQSLTFKFAVVAATGTPTVTVGRILNSWSEGGNTAPSWTTISTGVTKSLSGGVYTVTLTGDALSSWNTSGTPWYGIALRINGASTSYTIATREATTVANRPTMRAQLALSTPVSVTAPPMVANTTMPGGKFKGMSISTSAPVAVISLTMPQHRVGAGVKSTVIGAASASVSAPAPVVTARKNILVQAPATTFTLQFPGGVSRNPDQRVKAGFMEMWIFNPNPVQYISVPSINAAPPMEITLSGTSDNSISLKTDKRVFVISPMTAKINMVGIYQRNADRYLTIVPGTVDADDKWYQMEEFSGDVAIDATFDFSSPGVENNRFNATYVGGPTFGVEGPKLRKAVSFDGVDDHMVLPTQVWNIFDFTVEFSIRTTQQNGTIYRGGAPRSTPTAGTNPAVDTMDGLVIRNGELMLQVQWTDPANPLVYRTGKQIADGEWHHIVLSAPNPGAAQGMYAFGFSQSRQTFIMVDGVVEYARYIDFTGAHPAMPYKVMGRFNSTGPADALKGEMRDFIVRTNYAVSQRTASSLYYEWSETTLVKAPPAVLNLSAPQPYSARGNKKRMIVLYGLPYSLYEGNQPYTRDGWGNYISVFANYFIETNNGDVTGPTGEIYNWAGYAQADRNNPRMVFFNVRPFDLEGFKCYPVAVATTPGSTGAKSAPGMENGNARDLLTGQYVDNKTGLPRFINLQTDLLEDVSAFDAITAVNYPAVQAEENNVSADPLREFKQHNLGLNSNEWTAARDKLRDSILEAAYDGVSLWINEPHMAQHIGVIQGWDKHETGAKIEFGYAKLDPISSTGYTNWVASFIDLANRNNDDLAPADRDLIWVPGKNANSPSISFNLSNTVWTAGKGGQFNWTWQANAKRLIVNLEPGLTDIPSWFKSEQIKWEDDDAFRAHAQWTAYNLESRMNGGLQLNDLMVLPMRDQNSYTENYPAFDNFSVGIPRQWIVSARPDGIVGKVISKEMDTYWGPNGTVRTNPWRDNVYTIAAEAGSVVRGRPIAGRIFVEFMDTELTTTHLAEDRVKNMWNGEVGRDISRWSFDTRRYKQVIVTRVFETSISKTLPSGVKIKRKYEYEERNVEYQDQDVILRPYYSMNARGLNWISQAAPLAAGEVRQHTNAMTLNLSAGSNVKTTQGRNLVLPVPAMEITLELRQPKNYRGNDARERTSPMRLTMVMGGLGKTVKAPPIALTITAGLSPRVTGGGDRIYVYMDAERNVTLFMKEE